MNRRTHKHWLLTLILLLMLLALFGTAFAEFEYELGEDISFATRVVEVGETAVCILADELVEQQPEISWLMKDENEQEQEFPGSLEGNTARFTPAYPGRLSIKLTFDNIIRTQGYVFVVQEQQPGEDEDPQPPVSPGRVEILLDQEEALVGHPFGAKLDFHGEAPDTITCKWFYVGDYGADPVLVHTQTNTLTPSFTPDKTGYWYLRVDASSADGKTRQGTSEYFWTTHLVSPIECDIVFDQDTALIGIPLTATINLDADIPPKEVICIWRVSYHDTEGWEDAGTVSSFGPVTFTATRPGFVYLRVRTIDLNGEVSTFSSDTLRVEYKVSPIECDIKLSPMDGKEGQAVTATWTIKAEIPPKELEYLWILQNDEERQEHPAKVTGNSSSHVPSMGGWLMLRIITTDLNGMSEFFYSKQALIAGVWKGPKPVLTDKRLNDKVAEIAAKCNSSASGDYAKARWLHDYLVNNAVYDYTFTYYTPHAVLLAGTGVCEGFTRAYQLLLNAVGLRENKRISGTGNGGAHAWNLVRVDGSWYHVDTTWDIGGRHTYFLRSDEFMRKNHAWNASSYPAAPYDYGKGPTASKLRGDADGNGKLETADLVCVIESIVAGIPCPVPGNADLNGNGDVDLQDLTQLFALIPK